MTLREKLEAAAAARQVAGGDLRRERLLRIVRTRNKTALIGALSRFEEYFGRLLWGHGKPPGDCTPDELAWRAVWEECRTEVLNHGHAQLRALEKDLVALSEQGAAGVTSGNHQEKDEG